jgi:hypothetical protein
MVYLNTPIDMNGFEPVDNRPLSPGQYIAEIRESTIKDNKAGTGNYLELEYVVTDGEFKGRKIWQMITLKHSNPVPVQIGANQLKAIGHAVGYAGTIKDTMVLHNKKVVIVVADDGEYNGEPKTKVAKVKPLEFASIAVTSTTYVSGCKVSGDKPVAKEVVAPTVSTEMSIEDTLPDSRPAFLRDK